MLLLLTHPRKISLNPFQDLTSPTLTVFLDKPFGGIAIGFTAVARFTGWNNVVSNSTGTALRIVDRNEMIIAKAHILKQSRQTSTIGAGVMPIIQHCRPLLYSESCRKTAFPRLTSRLLNSYLLGMSRPIFFTGLVERFWMLFLITTLRGNGLVPVEPIPLPIIFGIITSPLLFILLSFLWVTLLPFLDIGYSLNLVRLIMAVATLFTSGLETVFSLAGKIEILMGSGYIPGASIAPFEGEGRVNHSAPRNANSHDVCGQDGTSAAFSGATLDHNLYFTALRLGAQHAA